MHHTIQNNKNCLGEFGCALEPQVRVQLFVFLGHALSPPPSAPSPQHSAFNSALSPQPSAPSSQPSALISLSPSSYSPRPSALSPEISAFNHHACTLGSPPWGGRASKYRLRARGHFSKKLFWQLIAYHCKKKKSGLRQTGCAR